MRNGRKKSKLLTALLVVVSCMLLVMPVLAAPGDGSGSGQGNGTGSGLSQSFGLASSTPTDGTKDFPKNGEIKLSFNKNVVNQAVKDNNCTCIALYSADGTKVPAAIIMADDQVNPEERQNVTIKPSQELANGTAYVVKISPQLKAKNGESLGREITVNFATAAAGTVSAPSNPEQKPAPTATTAGGTAETGQKNPSLIYIVAAGAILIAGVGYLYARKAGHK